jgi:unsaturated chondroitin disaccharide hydrolase
LGKGFPLAYELVARQAVRMSTLRNFLRPGILGGAAFLVATILATGCKTTCGTTAGTCAIAKDELLEIIPDNFTFAAAQYERLLASIANEPKLPRTFERGRVVMVTPEDWTSGFFPGSLWFLYEYTNDPKWLAVATNYTERLDRIKTFRGHHDVGFMLGCSYWQGLRLTQNPAYREVLIQGARSLATRYNSEVGLIRSWDFGRWKYPVIVDNLMNLELLTFAARESGEQRLYDIAVQHADKTLQNHFRADFSSYHVVDYNPTNGAVLRKMTQQGAADDSAWARGQAWGLYGFTAMFRETGDPAYLAQAVNIANYILNHPRLPADKIPYWDFDAPGIPNVPRDASAAAIISSALLELSGFVPLDLAANYISLARQQLQSLSSAAYRAAPGENGNFILKHSVGSHPEGREIDVPLNYADYYFLEALLRYQDLLGSNKCVAK